VRIKDDPQNRIGSQELDEIEIQLGIDRDVEEFSMWYEGDRELLDDSPLMGRIPEHRFHQDLVHIDGPIRIEGEIEQTLLTINDESVHICLHDGHVHVRGSLEQRASITSIRDVTGPIVEEKCIPDSVPICVIPDVIVPVIPPDDRSPDDIRSRERSQCPGVVPTCHHISCDIIPGVVELVVKDDVTLPSRDVQSDDRVVHDCVPVEVVRIGIFDMKSAELGHGLVEFPAHVPQGQGHVHPTGTTPLRLPHLPERTIEPGEIFNPEAIL